MDNMDFYSKVAKRPLTDIIPEEGEEKFWQDNFKNSNDLTLYSWRNNWLKNTKDNLEHFKYFNRDHSVKVFANELIHQPVILVGAGPSLANNIDKLLVAKEKGICIITNHHSVMYLSEYNIKPDFVCCLDAGEMWDEYFKHEGDWKDVPLLVDQTCDSSQITKWEGPVYFFRSANPTDSNIGKYLKMEMDRIINPFKQGSVIEVGGHVMGAMLSLARGVMQANTIIFVGADYCFNDKGSFYPFDHKIDQEVDGKYFGQEGKMLPSAPPPQGMILDIFGNMVHSNGAYLGFKNVMDTSIRINTIGSIQQNDDLEFINASEGGTLGALKTGNSKWMRYMKLEDAIDMSLTKKNNKKGI